MKRKLANYRCFYTSRTKGSISHTVQAKSVGHAAVIFRRMGFPCKTNTPAVTGGWSNLSIAFEGYV